ncbi:two-domain cob(I)yrinic acid a,c-diamide adenosyltransferase PduO [Yokenella regensburgei]|uniref:two-domain cob(I)yrinic acid a,c-diamide adenosyltransferase PduO n=1 Tax=Yokenella regensburgei TaxID=158877 RepID=UPI003F18EEFD
MAIYTRTGDAGTTALFSGQRVSKTHPRVETYGTLDELNSALSLCACAVRSPESRALLEAIELQIFWFSAELASESETPSPEQRYISAGEIEALERAIDTAMSLVDSVHSFILPGRCEAAARLHFARTLARRAERRLVELNEQINVRQVLMRYINRLSDCLFALARLEDHLAHQEKVIREVTTRYRAATQLPERKEDPHSLSFHELHQVVKAAMTRAAELHIPVVVSVVDANGIAMLTWRMPDALLVSNDLAPKKAWTAVAMKSPTHELSDAVQPGCALYGLETHMDGKVVTFGGGFPLWRDGNIIGGLGISGGSVEQDMDIAQTALAAINMGTK